MMTAAVRDSGGYWSIVTDPAALAAIPDDRVVWGLGSLEEIRAHLELEHPPLPDGRVQLRQSGRSITVLEQPTLLKREGESVQDYLARAAVIARTNGCCDMGCSYAGALPSGFYWQGHLARVVYDPKKVRKDARETRRREHQRLISSLDFYHAYRDTLALIQGAHPKVRFESGHVSGTWVDEVTRFVASARLADALRLRRRRRALPGVRELYGRLWRQWPKSERKLEQVLEHCPELLEGLLTLLRAELGLVPAGSPW